MYSSAAVTLTKESIFQKEVKDIMPTVMKIQKTIFYLSRLSLELCWEALSTTVMAERTSLTFLQKLKTILTFQNIILWVHLFYWYSMYEFIPRVLLNLISKLHDDSFSYFWKLIFLGSYFKHFSRQHCY